MTVVFKLYYMVRIDFPGGVRQYAVPMRWVLTYSPDRRWAVLCTDPGAHRLEVWSTLEGRCHAVIQEKSIELFSRVAFSAGGRYLAQSSDAGKSLTVWDGRTGAIAAHFETGGDYSVRGFSPTRRLLAVVMNRPEEGIDQTLFLDPLTGAVFGRARGHPLLPIETPTFSPCGRWFASAMTDNSLGYACRPDPSGTVYLTDLAPILPLAQTWESVGAD